MVLLLGLLFYMGAALYEPHILIKRQDVSAKKSGQIVLHYFVVIGGG
jgi:hypothetical protein